MDGVKFYKYVMETLNNLAAKRNIENLEKYFKLTDYQEFENYPNYNIKNLPDINQVFAQFALHAQNGTLRSNIIKFHKNFKFLSEKLFNFNPKEFYKHFKGKVFESVIEDLVERLRYDENNNVDGLKWDRSKSKTPDKIVTDYLRSLYSFAKYLNDNDINSKKDLIADLKNNYKGYNDYQKLIKYLKGKIECGMGVALCCDFLKELSLDFELPKPDVHIKDVLGKFLCKEYKDSDTSSYECIGDFLALLKDIKGKYNDVTAYKLDRAIWLCCTGNFFLDNNYDLKKSFLDGIE